MFDISFGFTVVSILMFIVFVIISYGIWGSIQEGIILSQQDDIDQYVRDNYEPHPPHHSLKFYGPSPFGLQLARYLKKRRLS